MSEHPKPYPGDKLFWHRANGGEPTLLSAIWRSLTRPLGQEDHDDLVSY